jgi:hypothetical protein
LAGSRAAVAALLAVALLLSACDSGGEEPVDAGASASLGGFREALRKLPCPPENLVLRSAQSYSAAAVRDARERSRFQVHEAEVRLEPPVDWLQDPYESKAFRGRLADLDWTGVLFSTYREQGDIGALRQAGDLILDWVRNQRRGGEGTSDQAWQGKAAGDRVLTLAYLARAGACEGTLSDRELRLLGDSIGEHVELLTDPEVYEPTNHGLYMDLSLALLSRQLAGVEGGERWAELATDRYEETFGSRIVEDEGLWLEHSAGYQILLTKLLAKSLATPGFASPELSEVLDRMRETSGWLVMPDGGLPQFGHTDQVQAPSFARSRAGDDRGLLALLDSGLAVVKEPGTYLSVLASFHSTAHKQADELTFDLYDQGLRIVSDTGLYHKDRDEFYEFASSPAAHSTLTVDGQGVGIEEGNAYGSGLIAAGKGDGWYAILGRNPLLREQGVEHTRLFLYKPGDALIVADRVRSDEKHVYRRHFQLGPEIEVQEVMPAVGLELSAPDFHGSLTSTASRGSEHVELARGERDPLRGWVFPGFREKVPRWTATFESRTKDADYTTTFDLSGDALEAGADWNREAPRVGLARGTSCHVVSVAREGDDLTPSVRRPRFCAVTTG